MEILQSFSRKYLTNCTQILEHGIISDGNCFFHALEYSDEKCDINPLYSDIMNSRTRIYTQAINRLERKRKRGDTEIFDVDSLQNIPIKRQIDKYTINKHNKEWTTRDIVYEASLYKNKNIFMFGWDQLNNTVGLSIIRNNLEKDNDFNENNILFLINVSNNFDGFHYITFKRTDVLDIRIDNSIRPTTAFLDKINKYRKTEDYLGSLNDMGIKPHGVVEYTLFMQNFEDYLYNNFGNFPNNMSNLSALTEASATGNIAPEPNANSFSNSVKEAMNAQGITRNDLNTKKLFLTPAERGWSPSPSVQSNLRKVDKAIKEEAIKEEAIKKEEMKEDAIKVRGAQLGTRKKVSSKLSPRMSVENKKYKPHNSSGIKNAIAAVAAIFSNAETVKNANPSTQKKKPAPKQSHLSEKSFTQKKKPPSKPSQLSVNKISPGTRNAIAAVEAAFPNIRKGTKF